jgi:hypothetical protein
MIVYKNGEIIIASQDYSVLPLHNSSVSVAHRHKRSLLQVTRNVKANCKGKTQIL